MSDINIFSGLSVAEAYAKIRRYEYDPKDGAFGYGALGDSDFARPTISGTPRRGTSSVKLVRRLVWLWHYAEWPPAKLHSVNGINWDNRIENLGMVLCDGHVEGFADQWTVYDHHRKRYGPLGTYPTWREAVAAWECRDLI